jgi:pimeloyl-ACP methyl ester carboxylesterase
VWLDPGFESWDIRAEFLPRIRCPVLGIQGYDDEYGTMAQLDEMERRLGGPCELLKLENCGHAPFRDQPERTLSAVNEFIDKLIR